MCSSYFLAFPILGKMISSSIQTYLDTLAGYIFDDDKLVTYKWLSKELGLHVNQSKQILWQFFNEHEKRDEVLATFTLMGYLVDGDYRVEIVKESDLKPAKKKFGKLTAEHLYSLQRALPDIELLALTGTGDHRHSAIVCKEVTPRDEKELGFLRWGSRFVDHKAAPNFAEKTPRPKLKSDKNGLKDMFGKVNNKEVPQNSRGLKRQGSEDRGAIGTKRQKLKVDAASRSSEESSCDEEDEPELDCGPELEAAKTENAAAGPSPAKYKMEQGKRKVRKIVDKTSMDSNGYFVTNKEYVYESCSDGEDPAPEAPKPKAATSKANRKQASLLNFFKKS